MKHVKNFKLFEFGENSKFTIEEIEELTNLGFIKVEDKFIYKDKTLELKIGRDSLSYKGEFEDWYSLIVSYNPMFQHMTKEPEHFKKFDMNLLNPKSEQFDTFEELIENINMYIKK